MSAERVTPFYENFERADVILHGTLTRYAMVGLWKLGLRLPNSVSWRVTAIDDRICSLVRGLRSKGSSVALLGTRAVAIERPAPTV